MSAAQITIGIQKTKDGNHSMGINFVGDENMLIPLLGAMTHASQWVSNRISNRVGEGAWGNVDGVQTPPAPQAVHNQPEAEYPTEQKLPRDKAIEATEYAMKSLQMRLDKMKESPDSATFAVDTALLQKL